MSCLKYFTLCLLFCATFSGCATLLNGSTQNVYIAAPSGTTIQDTSGKIIPMTQTFEDEYYITLKRNRDYDLHFTNNGKEVSGRVPRSIGGGWVFLDIILDVFPVFIDWATGDWYLFDDLKIEFPGDTTKVVAGRKSYVQSFERLIQQPVRPKVGGLFFVGAGLEMPVNSNPIFFTAFDMGLGYQVFPKLDVILRGSLAGDLSITTHSSDIGTSVSSVSASLEARYSFFDGIFAAAGAGWSQISSNSIKYSEAHYDASTKSTIVESFTLAPVDKVMPLISLGIGYSGSLGFIELRHIFGLSKFLFSNGETNSFSTTAFIFGLNAHF